MKDSYLLFQMIGFLSHDILPGRQFIKSKHDIVYTRDRSFERDASKSKVSEGKHVLATPKAL